MSLSLRAISNRKNHAMKVQIEHTGTFFCEITTAQSFPRTPTDVMFAAVIALNAYSNDRRKYG